jgi:hypothetical protein
MPMRFSATKAKATVDNVEASVTDKGKEIIVISYHNKDKPFGMFN